MSAGAVGTRSDRALQLLREFFFIAGQAPMDRRPLGEWIEEFQAVGFFAASYALSIGLDGVHANVNSLTFRDMRPREPVPLYRVCTPGREVRAHWTPFISLAARYAPGGDARVANQPGAHLYSTIVEPEGVLAILESEWVIDPRGRVLRDHGRIENVAPRQLLVRDLPESSFKDALMRTVGPVAKVEESPQRTLLLSDQVEAA
ncbi:hypothetical protein [Microbacterium paludicola]|uniref:hypothetical protein n=1 Tax=Microbacterium paludicola TaxID=300019 RepID=UPI0031E2104E